MLTINKKEMENSDMAIIIIILIFLVWKMLKFSFNVIFPLLFLLLILLWIAEIIKFMFPIIIIFLLICLALFFRKQRS
ncbi:hypothetical protein LM596_05505 [Liquorilactobacillus mali]|nr:hypothetical protein LMA_01479 [Liquorilactobacillus mali KCTC 3596 = DSM 20444]QFQ74604.1 hypothetical protein LM596_05505 [Liquorilactobacillus mali]